MVTALVVLGGCATSPHPARRTTTTTSRPSSTTTRPPTSTTATTAAPSTSTTAPVPAGGPVPAGFTPVSFTAVSEDDYWVLGSAPCANPVCTSIVRTTDGGVHFVGIPAPAAPLTSPTSTAPSISELRFADVRDGFAYGLSGQSYDNTGDLWATHDAGATWHRVAVGNVVAFATGGGTAYAVTGQCGASGCTDFALMRSPVSSDAWHASPLPFAVLSGAGDPVLAAHGSDVWIMGPTGSSLSAASDTVARSTDGGTTFTTATAPCTPGLGGELAPSSSAVVWAYCPTGNFGGAYRSSDGGATFTRLPSPESVNAAVIAPASDTTAVLTESGNRTLSRTTDAGATWAAAATPPAGTYVSWVGFTDATTGAALVPGTSGAMTLWRTTDAGDDWSPVAF